MRRSSSNIDRIVQVSPGYAAPYVQVPSLAFGHSVASPSIRYTAPSIQYAAPSVRYTAPTIAATSPLFAAHSVPVSQHNVAVAPVSRVIAQTAVHTTPIQHVAPVHHVAPAVHALPAVHVASHEHQDEYAHPRYEFAYGVEDHHTGDIHSHKEARDGDVTQGEYSLHEADGTIRTVKYTVDKHSGFNAVVERTGQATHQRLAHVATPVLTKAVVAAPTYAAPGATGMKFTSSPHSKAIFCSRSVLRAKAIFVGTLVALSHAQKYAGGGLLGGLSGGQGATAYSQMISGSSTPIISPIAMKSGFDSLSQYGIKTGYGYPGQYILMATYPKYQFSYGVSSPITGDRKSQYESRDGDFVKGYYTVDEPDGTQRTVYYTSDGVNGFNAVVKKTGQAMYPAFGVYNSIATGQPIYAPSYGSYKYF
ncbi:hypothetical protein NQ317_007766 [Molorchus minor]|uniref:Cuticle protein n=1 Tax=Molorchus minor TaxID=1323400 RepID=A0ABQ9IUU9_9CUCU|nr:hypothetical protein NQ317_007766 [Molorchus minor]